MASNLAPELIAAAAYSDHKARHVPLLVAFERALKIGDEMMTRVERDMYAPDVRGRFDSKLATAFSALGRVLAQMGAVHARLLQEESARADILSDAEKVQYMLQAMLAKPASIRQQFAAQLLGAP